MSSPGTNTWLSLMVKRNLVEFTFLKWEDPGLLAGSAGKACKSWFQGYEFKLHGGYRDYLKIQSLKNKLSFWHELNNCSFISYDSKGKKVEYCQLLIFLTTRKLMACNTYHYHINMTAIYNRAYIHKVILHTPYYLSLPITILEVRQRLWSSKVYRMFWLNWLKFCGSPDRG